MNIRKCFIISISVILMMFYICIPVSAVEITSLRTEVPEEKIYCTVEEELEFMEFIGERIGNLKTAGVDPNIFTDLEIKVYPAYAIIHRISALQKDTVLARGFASSKFNFEKQIISSNITLAMGSGENVLYHELGHVVEGRKLGVYGYDWTNANEIGQQYIQAKEYTQGLKNEDQLKLSWEERLSEWFAEDVKHFIQEHVLEYGVTSDHYKGIPKRTKEVDKILEKLILGDETIVNTTVSTSRA
jgi:hypothetical protein